MIQKFENFLNESNESINDARAEKDLLLDKKINAIRKCFLYDPAFVTKAMGFKTEDLASGDFVFDKEIKNCLYPFKTDIDKLLKKWKKCKEQLVIVLLVKQSVNSFNFSAPIIKYYPTIN